jgi:hypothetical protein
MHTRDIEDDPISESRYRSSRPDIGSSTPYIGLARFQQLPGVARRAGSALDSPRALAGSGGSSSACCRHLCFVDSCTQRGPSGEMVMTGGKSRTPTSGNWPVKLECRFGTSEHHLQLRKPLNPALPAIPVFLSSPGPSYLRCYSVQSTAIPLESRNWSASGVRLGTRLQCETRTTLRPLLSSHTSYSTPSTEPSPHTGSRVQPTHWMGSSRNLIPPLNLPRMPFACFAARRLRSCSHRTSHHCAVRVLIFQLVRVQLVRVLFTLHPTTSRHYPSLPSLLHQSSVPLHSIAAALSSASSNSTPSGGPWAPCGPASHRGPESCSPRNPTCNRSLASTRPSQSIFNSQRRLRAHAHTHKPESWLQSADPSARSSQPVSSPRLLGACALPNIDVLWKNLTDSGTHAGRPYSDRPWSGILTRRELASSSSSSPGLLETHVTCMMSFNPPRTALQPRPGLVLKLLLTVFPNLKPQEVRTFQAPFPGTTQRD